MKAFLKKNAAYLAVGIAALVIAAVYYQTSAQEDAQSTNPSESAEVETEKSSSEVKVQPVKAAAPAVESVNKEAKPSVNSAPSNPVAAPKSEKQETPDPECENDEIDPGC